MVDSKYSVAKLPYYSISSMQKHLHNSITWKIRQRGNTNFNSILFLFSVCNFYFILNEIQQKSTKIPNKQPRSSSSKLAGRQDRKVLLSKQELNSRSKVFTNMKKQLFLTIILETASNAYDVQFEQNIGTSCSVFFVRAIVGTRSFRL